ncbi:MAG: GMP synthase, partial [Ferruginibacter sp.]
MNSKKTIRIAILDLYDGFENQGMRCIREILNQFADYNHLSLHIDEFDVRKKQEIPSINYDIYISTGGPGSPLDSAGTDWDNLYFDWYKSVEDYNNNPLNEIKKQVFLICHSFQIVCRQYNIAEVSKRKSTSFGVFPIHCFPSADSEPVFKDLRDPFYAVDSRDYQVTQPNHKLIREMGGRILAI